MDFSTKRCAPCEGGVSPLQEKSIKESLSYLKTTWEVVDKKKIRKEFSFKNFKEAMKFVNSVADIAHGENHHPDISIHWNKVVIELWTHAIGGLSENDFIVASKIEKI